MNHAFKVLLTLASVYILFGFSTVGAMTASIKHPENSMTWLVCSGIAITLSITWILYRITEDK